MAQIAPAVKEKFDTLPTELKNVILEKDVQVNTIYDLMDVLQDIVDEEEKNNT